MRLTTRGRAELQAALPGSLHPVLRRVYGARSIAGPDELALRLDQLLPVSEGRYVLYGDAGRPRCA